MTAFSFDIVGFDLDGTLVDSGGDLAAAINFMLAEDGRPTLAVAEVVAMTGAGVTQLVRRALDATGGASDAEVDRLRARMQAYYADHIAVLTQPYPGMVAAVEALRARGVKTAVVTNKLEALAVKLLGELGLADLFDTVIGGDTTGRAKPDPAPVNEMIRRCIAMGSGGKAAFVGDTMFDVGAAQQTGIPVVIVSFGHAAAAPTGADATIDHFDALIPALERLAA